MRAVLQRVKSASVEVDGQIISNISSGWLCLIGIKDGDTDKDAEYICKKLLKTRAWSNPESERGWEKDVVEMNYELLLVSQFTLYGRLKKPKPDFSKAMTSQEAREFYERFVALVRGAYQEQLVKDGVFGAMMDVNLLNDGPVTFILDSDTDS